MPRTHGSTRTRRGATKAGTWRFVVSIEVNALTVDAAYAHLHVLLARCAWGSVAKIGGSQR